MKKNTSSIILITSYFPSIIYVKNIVNFTNTYIENYEYYKRHGMRNRAWILGANGKILLTVPIVRKSYSKTIIKNIKIANNNWQKKHINSIKSAYGSSPFFIHYFNDIENILNKNYTFLIDLNNEILHFILESINTSQSLKKTTEYIKKYPANFVDARHSTDLKLKYNLDGYHQVFNKNFIPNMSILDLIFNLGPNAKKYISGIKTN